MLEKGVDAGAAAVGGWNGYLGAREGIRKGAGGYLYAMRIHTDARTYTQMVLTTIIWAMTSAVLFLNALIF